jgi:hypothetical protein
MEFEHEAHWQLYQTVRDCLKREFGNDVEMDEETPTFFLQLDESPMLVVVGASGPKAAVTIYARPGSGLEITPEIAIVLLRVNYGHEIPFGTLGLNDDNAVSFSHVLMGEGLDPDALSLLLHLLSSKLDDIEQLLAEASH